MKHLLEGKAKKEEVKKEEEEKEEKKEEEEEEVRNEKKKGKDKLSVLLRASSVWSDLDGWPAPSSSVEMGARMLSGLHGACAEAVSRMMATAAATAAAAEVVGAVIFLLGSESHLRWIRAKLEEELSRGVAIGEQSLMYDDYGLHDKHGDYGVYDKHGDYGVHDKRDDYIYRYMVILIMFESMMMTMIIFKHLPGDETKKLLDSSVPCLDAYSAEVMEASRRMSDVFLERQAEEAAGAAKEEDFGRLLNMVREVAGTHLTQQMFVFNLMTICIFRCLQGRRRKP